MYNKYCIRRHLRTPIIIFTFIFGFSVSAQKVKKKEERKPGSTIQYYVLKSDKNIKHGRYSEIGFRSKILLESGNYVNGKKEGLWFGKYMGKGSYKYSGKYKDGKKVGVWYYFDYKENILQEYNYDSQKMIVNNDCDTGQTYETYIDQIWTPTRLDCAPSYIGGHLQMCSYINQKFLHHFNLEGNKKFENKLKNAEDPVIINYSFSVLVKKNGTIGKVKMEEFDVSQGLKNIFPVLELKEFFTKEVQALTDVWIPGILNGEKVDAYYKIGTYSITSWNKDFDKHKN